MQTRSGLELGDPRTVGVLFVFVRVEFLLVLAGEISGDGWSLPVRVFEGELSDRSFVSIEQGGDLFQGESVGT